MSSRLIGPQRSWWRRSSRRTRAGKVLDQAIAPVMEGLEGRTMLVAWVDGNSFPKIRLIGDDTDEHIRVVWQSGNLLQFTVNGTAVDPPFDSAQWQIEIYGNGGNDTIEGFASTGDTLGIHDLIDGGPGDDVIMGWRGNDTLKGSDGFDTVMYSYRSAGGFTSGVNVHLGNNTVSMTGESDTISGFEALTGSSFADTLTGSAGDNVLDGGDGNDTVSALAGDDTISGGKGDDVLSGGGDQDTINYLYRASAGVDVDLLTEIMIATGETDTISSFEHAWGSSFDDKLKGTDIGNSLMGGGGADSLVGRGGNDTIHGDGLTDEPSDGNDTLKGDAGDDYLQGDAGLDSLYGSAGDDTLVGGKGVDHIDGGSEIDLTSYADHWAYRDVILSDNPLAYWRMGDASGTTVSDSSGNDRTGTYRPTSGGSWTGGTLAANGALTVDTDGAAAFNGTSGYVKVNNFTPPTAAMTVEAWVYAKSRPAWGSILKNWTDNVFGFVHLGLENASGNLSVYIAQSGGAYIGPVIDDVQFPLKQWVHVAAVADGTHLRLYRDGVSVGTPMAYDGTLKGGMDTLAIGGKLKDDLSGPSTNTPGFWDGRIDEVAVYATGLSPARVAARYASRAALSTSGPVYLNLNNRLDEGESDDVQDNVEQIYGSMYGDVIHGSSDANTIWGGEGNDSILGLGGNDLLFGGLGLPDKESGNDTIDGGTGDDQVYGEDGADVVRGDDGQDVLYGGKGVDNLTGGIGDDTLYGGINSPTTASGNDILNGGGGNDALYGEDGDDSLQGSTENDTLYGGSGNDMIEGGGGSDVARYNERWRVAGVRVRMDGASLLADGHELDVVSLTESIRGSAYADTITGGAQPDHIDALGGADVIDGGGGNDTLLGGGGNDTLIGFTGADSINGGAGRDAVDYGYMSAGVTINLSDPGTGGDGDALNSIEDLFGTAAADTLTGSGDGSYIDARGGDDLIYEVSVSDTLVGGDGADRYGPFGATAGLASPVTERVDRVSVVDGRFVAHAVWNSVVAGNVTAADVVVTAEFTRILRQEVGLIARYSNPLSYYIGRLEATPVGAAEEGTIAVIQRVDSGIMPYLAYVPLGPVGTSGTLRFEVQGTQLRLFLNDVLVADAVDSASTIAATGAVGFMLNRRNLAESPSLWNLRAEAVVEPGNHANVVLAPSTGAVGSARYWDPRDSSNFSISLQNVVSGDFDGDGHDDIAGLHDNQWRVGFSDGFGGFVTQPASWLALDANRMWTNVFVGDFNGDGRDDLAGVLPATLPGVAPARPPVWETAISSGSGFVTRTSDISVEGMTDLNVLDLNGDGRDDLIARDSNGFWNAAISQGVTLKEYEWGRWECETMHDVRVGDFNADGRDDLVARKTDGTLAVSLSTGRAFQVRNWGSWAGENWYDVRVGNFDGVGGDDLIGRNSATSGTWHLALSGGFGFSNQTRSAEPNLESVLVGDFDGNGRDDLLGRVSGTRTWKLAATSGSTFTTSERMTTLATMPMNPTTVVGDFTGTLRKAAKAFEEVYNNIRYEPYAGLMKGAQATKDTGRGNAWDQAGLLIEKLRAAGIEARFALGRMKATEAKVVEWLGVGDGDDVQPGLDADAAEALLKWVGLDPVRANGLIDFRHVWVQAKLPGSGGYDWRNIDASWKFRHLQDGIDTGVVFDAAAYHSQIRRETALEYYESLVAASLRTSHPGKSLADVPRDGPIIARSFNESMYNTLGAQNADGATYITPVSAPDDLPASERHRVEIELWGHLPATMLDVSVDGTKPIIVRYVKTSEGLIPELVVGGEVRTTGTLISSTGTQTVQLHLTHFNPDFMDDETGEDEGDESLSFSRTAGQPLAIGLGAGQGSAKLLAEWQARLNRLAVDAHDDQVSAQEYQELLLAYTELRYFYYLAIDSASIAALTHGAVAQANVMSGVMTGDDALQVPEPGAYHWQLQNPIFAGRMSTDNPNVAVGILPATGKVDFTSAHSRNANLLLAESMSSQEHQILEEVLNAESVSTVKGLQWARSQPSNVPVYIISRPNTAIDKPVVLNPVSSDGPKLVDGSGSTTWTVPLPGPGEPAPYMQVDLGTTKDIENVILHHDVDNYAAGFHVEVSATGLSGSWSRIFSSVQGQAMPFVQTSGRFVRVTLVEPAPGAIHYTYAELGVLDDMAYTTEGGATASQEVTNLNMLTIEQTAKGLIQSALNSGLTVVVPRDPVALGTWSGAVWIEEEVWKDSATYGYQILRSGTIVPNAGGYTSGQPISSFYANFSETSVAVDWGDPVNVRSGSMSHDEQDVSIPAPGIPLVFARHYESSYEEDRGMGVGWLHTYSHFLKFDEPLGSDYERVTWTTSQGNRHEFLWNGSAYASPDELHGKLTRSGTEFLYREKDGTRFRFDATGKLLFIKDRNDNALNMSYNSIGQLSSVTSGTSGPSLWFDYDFATGKLITVRHGLVPAWTYTYHLNNSLASATSAPNATMPVPLKMEYAYYEGGLLHGLMKTITDVNDGGTHTYDYYPNRRAFRTTDSEGHQEFFSYDLFHNRTIYTNPRGHTSVHDFNANPDRDRLVLHWGLDEPHDSNVADGKANDESGIGNHGTIKANSGETRWDNGVMGGALKLAPADSIIDTFDASWTPTEFTVSWWMNPSVINGTATHKLSANDDWGAFRFTVDEHGAVEVGTTEDTRFTNIPAGTVKAGEWQHFSFTYSGGSGRFYRNGVRIGAKTMDAPEAWTKFKIYDADGAVDDVRVYARRLGDAEVAALRHETETVIAPDRTRTSQVKLRQLVKQTLDELGRTETFEHDVAGNVTRLVSKDAIETRFVYESVFNHLVRTSVTGGPVTSFAHDDTGNVVAVTQGTNNLAHKRLGDVSSSLAGYNRSRALDGDPQTAWQSSDTATGAQWFYVDLGSSFAVNGVRIDWDVEHYATAYEVQLSNDANDFEGPDAVELYATTTGNGGVVDLRNLSGTGRYLRIYASTPASSRYGLDELEVYGSANLAMGRPAAAPQNGASATATADGKLSTQWSSLNNANGSSNPDDQYLRIDLGAPVPINGVKIVWGAGEHATSYQIRGSDVADDPGAVLRTVNASVGGVDLLTDFTGTARFIRIVPLSSAGSKYTIKEFEIYGNRHISRNRSVTTSSNLADAGKAVDGDTSGTSIWQAAAPGAVTLDVDLGSVFHVAGARIHWYDPSGAPKHAAKDYSLQVSTDGQTWASVYRTLDGDGGVDRITSISGVGRYVRLLMTEPLDAGQSFGLRDLEFYAATTTMTYDKDRKLLIARTEPKGNVANAVVDFRTSYTYHPSGLVHTTTVHGVREEDGAVATTTSLYDDRGYLTQSTDVRGFTTTITRDPLGNALTTSLPAVGSPAVVPTVVNTYKNGLLETARDPRGNTTGFDYDKMERQTRVVNPDGTYRTSTYDGLGNLTSSTDELGRTTRFFYDARNRLVQMLRADGTSEFTTYDGAGRVVSQYDPLGNETTYIYEGDSDRVRTVTDAAGQSTTYTYDALGRLTKEEFDDNTSTDNDPVSDPDPGVERETLYEVDLLGRVTKTIGPRKPNPTEQNYSLGTTLYDAHGNVTSQVRYKIDLPDGGAFTIPTDPMTMDPARQRRTDYEYDAADRRTLELLPDPDAAGDLPRPETTYKYDRAGNVRFATQVVRTTVGGIPVVTSNVTDYQYDELGRKKVEILPDPGNGKRPTTTYSYDVAGNLTGLIGPRGNTTATPDLAFQTTHSYDSLNRQVSVTSPDPDGLSGTIFTAPVTASEYDAVGHLVGFTDALGHTTRYEYDALGRKTKEILPDPDGAGDQLPPITVYDYDDAGNLKTVTSPRGHLPGANPAHFTTTYTYDALNRKLTETLPHPTGGDPLEAPETTLTYKHGQLWKTTDALGRVTELRYDGSGRMVKEITPDGPVTSPWRTMIGYEYNSLGELVLMTNPIGFAETLPSNKNDLSTLYEYDALGRTTKETQPDPSSNGTADDRPITRYQYDAAGNLWRVLSPLGNVGIVNPDWEDPAHTTEYTYDNLGRKTVERLPDPDGPGPLTAPKTDFDYDEAGNLVKVTDARLHITEHVYDRLERKVKTLEPDPDLSSSIEPPVTRYVYDANGNLTDVIGPLETASDATLYAEGPLALQSLHKTTYTYDALGRKVAETLASADDDLNTTDRPTTLYAYDADDTLLRITDPVGNETTYAYDNIGRKMSETNELGESRTFTYDKVGNVTSITDRNGKVRTFAYDERDRLTQEAWVDPTAARAISTITYDGSQWVTVVTSQPHGFTNGWRVWMAGSDKPEFNGVFPITWISTTSFKYPIGSAPGLTPPASAAAMTATRSERTFTISYNTLGLESRRMEYDATGGAAHEYRSVHDNLGRLKEIYTAQPTYRDWHLNTWNVAGQRTRLVTRIGTTISFIDDYVYDNLGRLKTLTQHSGGATDKRVGFTYDALGQYDTITRYADLAGSVLVATSTYGYDDANRLTSLTHAGASGATIGAYTWGHDAAGRITSYTDVGANVATYDYDNNGQLLSTSNTARPGQDYSYDANGNRTMGGYDTWSDNLLLSGEGLDYQYDDEGNRTIATNYDTFTYSWGWDRRGRLGSFHEFNHAGGEHLYARYTYDPYDRRRTKEVDSDGDGVYESVEHYVYDGNDLVMVVDGNWQVKQRYLFGPELDMLLAEQTSAGVRWTLADHQNSARTVIDGAGTVTSTAAYDAYGNVISGTVGRFGFTGREHDAETGLIHYRRRYYDPRTGGFLSHDPAGFDAGDANLGRYVFNNPVNYTDPSGLSARAIGRLGNDLGAGLGLLSPVVGGVVSSVSAASEAAPSAWSLWNTLPEARSTHAMVNTTFQAGITYSYNHANTARLETGRLRDHYQLSNPGLASQYSARNAQWIDYLTLQSAQRTAAATGQLTNHDPGITAAGGALTGLKANVNALSETVVSTVTLGQYQLGPVWSVTDTDLSNGYGASYMFARGGYELLAGVGTAGLANLKTGGTAIRVAGQTARMYDAAGNVANVAEGFGSVYDNGLTWSNAAQLAGGLAGLRGNFSDYAVKIDPSSLGTLGGNVRIVKGVQAYEVGAYNDLARRSVGDDFAIHHVGQGHPMAQVVPGYNYLQAPAIAIPRDMHYDIQNLKGPYTGTARNLVARDIRNLRNYTDAPNASLKNLIQLNKDVYPKSF